MQISCKLVVSFAVQGCHASYSGCQFFEMQSWKKSDPVSEGEEENWETACHPEERNKLPPSLGMANKHTYTASQLFIYKLTNFLVQSSSDWGLSSSSYCSSVDYCLLYLLDLACNLFCQLGEPSTPLPVIKHFLENCEEIVYGFHFWAGIVVTYLLSLKISLICGCKILKEDKR